MFERNACVKHLLSISDLSKNEIESLLKLAEKLKEEKKRGEGREYLKNKNLAMIFELPSTRTRISFEVAMAEMGGHALYLNWNDLQLGRGETIKDTAHTISRYVDAVMMRVRKHETLMDFARFSSVPVINGLSNLEHPCQILSDLLTIKEKVGKIEGVRITWVGDGNNVCNSLILAATIMGMEITVSCPKGYEPSKEIIRKALEIGGKIRFEEDPEKAVKGAEVIYTDVWVSMGQEKERKERLRVFRPYQVNSELLSIAKDAIVMHCLPAHRGEEITDEVIDGKNSVVFDQAENRLHMQKAILLYLLQG